MSVAFPSPDGIPTAFAARSRGSSGFTVTGFVVAAAGGVAYGTFGCDDGGFAVAAGDPAAPDATVRGDSTLQPRAERAARDAATPPVMYETRLRSSRREIRPST